MQERTTLITARREAEDSLVKTLIQLSSALIVLIAGFLLKERGLEGALLQLLVIGSLLSLVVSVVSGLSEHYFSSKAYLSQQQKVEDYYTKKIANYTEPEENRYVRKSQLAAFVSFVISLVLIGLAAILNVGVTNVERSPRAAASPASITAAPATS